MPTYPVFTFTTASGLAVSSTTSSGTVAYTGALGLPRPPTPNEALHPAQEQHGPDEVIMIFTVAGAALTQAVKRSRWGSPS